MFNGYLHLGPQPLLNAVDVDLSGTNVYLDVARVVLGEQPLAGTYTLTYGNEVTKRLAWNAAPSDVEAQLSALTGVGVVSVTRTPNVNGFNWIVTFVSVVTPPYVLAANGAGLTGPSARVSVSRQVVGVAAQGLQSVDVTDLSTDPDYFLLLTGLTVGTPYSARVRAGNAHGLGGFALPTPVFEVPRQAPDAVVAYVMALSDTSIKLVWQPPASNGATIDYYELNWDSSPVFANLSNPLVSFNLQAIYPAAGMGPTAYYNVDGLLPGVTYYVRIRAHNNRGYSPYSNVPSATTSLLLPGAPLQVSTTVLSGVQILVQWAPPSDELLVYGGDGGAAIEWYLIEWARPAFSVLGAVPPGRANVSAADTSFIIGYRNESTGQESGTLERGYQYEVRVAARNSLGFGPYAFPVPTASLMADQQAYTPPGLELQATSGSTVVATWDLPEFDGGCTLQTMEISYSTSPSNTNPTTINLPLVMEEQTVSVVSEAVNEVQWVDILTPVTNEVQTVYTTVNGLPEIQTVTMHQYPVINEVQTFTTYANQIDEIQTFTTIADQIQEVQLIQIDGTRQTAVLNITTQTAPQQEVQKLVISTWDDSLPALYDLIFQSAHPSEYNTFQLHLNCPANNSVVYLKYSGTPLVPANPGVYSIDLTSLGSAAPASAIMAYVQTALAALPIPVTLSQMGTPNSGYAWLRATCNQNGYVLNPYTAAAADPANFLIQDQAAPGFTRTYLQAGQLFILSTDATSCDLCPLPYADLQTTALDVIAVAANPSLMGAAIATMMGYSAGASAVSVSLDLTQPHNTTAGYTFLITFVTSAGGVAPKGNIPQLQVTPTHITNPYSANTLTMSTVQDGAEVWGTFVLQMQFAHANPARALNVTTVPINANAPATGTVGISMTEILEATGYFPNVSVSRTIASPQGEYTWLISFPNNDGYLPPFTVSTNSLTSAGGSPAVLSSVQTPGLFLGGNFSLLVPGAVFSAPSVGIAPVSGYYPPILVNVTTTPAQLQAAMDAVLGAGAVSVQYCSQYPLPKPNGPGWNGGYRWAVQFLTIPGSLGGPMLTVNNLTGINNPTITIGTGASQITNPPLLPQYQVTGNSVGGSFSLSVSNGLGLVNTTSPITISASTTNAQIQAAFLPVSVTVTRTNIPNVAAGFTYTVTFTDANYGGSLPLMTVVAGGTFTGINQNVVIDRIRAGNQLRGSFFLSFGYSPATTYYTGEMSYNDDPADVAAKLELLPNIGNVVVNRSVVNVQTQTYQWTVTFVSNVYSGDSALNWDSGFSEGWGANVGDNMPLLGCHVDELYASSDYKNSVNCTVAEVVKGTAPVNGYFTLTYDTTNCATCLVQTLAVSNPIRMDALPCNAELSVEAALEAMPNVGLVTVTRSAVNATNGAYQWTITFDSDIGGLNAGDVKGLVPTGLGSFKGSITNEEVRKGNILRGNYTLGLGSQTTAPIPWNASAAQVWSAVVSGLTNTVVNVSVTAAQVNIFGQWQWNITFIQNVGVVPPGTLNVPPLVLNSSGLYETAYNLSCPSGDSCLTNHTLQLNVTETVQGSTPLSGTFTLDLGIPSSPTGPRTLAFNAPPSVIQIELQELKTVQQVSVSRSQYQDVNGNAWGWNSLPTYNQLGGWRVYITFVQNAGSYYGFTLPPGSGNQLLFNETHTNLLPPTAFVRVTEAQPGSVPLGGTFTLQHLGKTTGDMKYGSSAVDVQNNLTALWTIGSCNVTQGFSVDNQLPGTVAATYLSPLLVTSSDLTQRLVPGDVIRVGGAVGSANVLPGSNGEVLLGQANFTANTSTPVFAPTNFRSSLWDGQVVRIGNAVYTVVSNGAQLVTISVTGSGVQTFALTAGSHGTTSCLLWNASPSVVQNAIASLLGASDADIRVEVSGASPTVYSVWINSVLFDGVGVTFTSGNVAAGCGVSTTVSVTATRAGLTNSFNVSSTYVAVANLSYADVYWVPPLYTVQNQHIERFYIVVTQTAGSTAGSFKIAAGASFTGCISFAASAAGVQSAFTGAGAPFLTTTIVTVTQTTTSGGMAVYTYGVYAPVATHTTNLVSANCATAPSGYSVVVNYIDTAVANPVFSSTQLPLATLTNADTAATWVGPSATALNIYKVDGLTSTVTFSTNIGDQPAMVSNVTNLIGANASVFVQDNYVEGYTPLSTTLTGLNQGIEYFVRVASTNCISPSAWSDDVAVIPMQAPHPPRHLAVDVALQVQEIQAVTTGATHIPEVQVVTTTAMVIPEVQTIRTHSNTYGLAVNGQFAITATINGVVQTTGYLSSSATDVQVQAALNTLLGTSCVVVRTLISNDGGYAWAATFNTATGPMPLLSCPVTGPNINCVASQDIQRNMIGGTFRLGLLGQTTNDLAVNTTAQTLALALDNLIVPQSTGTVNVVQTGPDSAGGYSWTVTFVGLYGDVPTLTALAAFTGTGAAISVTPLTQGNQLSGTFTLKLGSTTTALPYNAPALTVQNALNYILPRSVNVSRVSTSVEGGYTWYVTFSQIGNVPELVADGSGLGGVNAAITVTTVINGSEATSSKLAVSFAPPLDNGGYAVSSYVAEVATDQGFSANKATFVVSDNSLLLQQQEIFLLSDPDVTTGVVGGTWSLTYGSAIDGANTGPLAYNIDPISLREALEALPGISAVNVVQGLSRIPLSGTGNVSSSDLSTLLTSDNVVAQGVKACDTIWIGETQFTVYQTGLANYSVPLGSATDCTQRVLYSGAQQSRLLLYKYGGGNKYTVFFVGFTAPILPLFPPLNNLVPSTATVRVAGGWCNKCVYLTGLIGTLPEPVPYYVHVAAVNSIDQGAFSETVTAVPMQVPGAPARVTLSVVSGTTLQIQFSEGLDGNNAITSYTIQWDPTDTFNSVGGSPAGQFIFTGDSLLLAQPYVYLISTMTLPNSTVETLTPGTTLFARVAAQNSVPYQNNVAWAYSQPASATTANLAPQAPASVTAGLYTGTSAQLLIQPPARNGGVSVSSYVVMYDVSPRFTASPVNVSVPVASITQLYTLGPYVYTLTGLPTGVTLYVAVQAVNSVGSSPWTTPVSVFLQQPASAPVNPTLTTPQSSAYPITTMTIAWQPPASNGAGVITNYLVEWWQTGGTWEVQHLVLINNMGAADTAGTFSLLFGGVATTNLGPAATAVDVRSALLNAAYAATPQVSEIIVTRSNYDTPGDGYVWSITFKQTGANPTYGDVPQIVVPANSLHSISGHGSVSLAIIDPNAPGSRPNGTPTVQQVSITATAGLGGFFRLTFDTFTTPWLAYNVGATELATVLTELPTAGQVAVTQTVSTATSVAWLVTFSTLVGNVEPLQIDASNLVGTSLTAKITLGNAINLATSAVLCPGCALGEAPLNYSAVNVSATTFAYTVTDLVPGWEYHARVTAVTSFSLGVAVLTSPSAVVIPLQQPGVPTDVLLSVSPSGATALNISYAPPVSDGGDPILTYRVEYSLSSTFSDIPPYVTFPCPTAREMAIWTVTTSNSSGRITHGTFSLTISHDGVAIETQAMAWNASAMRDDEAAAGSVYCNTCPVVSYLGSVQSHIEDMPFYTEGVAVTRTPRANGGYTWSITFLDDGDSWSVGVGTTTALNTAGLTVTPALLQHGENAVDMVCLPSQQINSLVKGTPYYFRVSASNSIGYGLPAVANGGQPLAPQEAPGRPTSVSLEVVGGCQLRTCFSPPFDDGGNAITKYNISWSTNSTFGTNTSTQSLLTLSTGKLCSTINGLVTGTVYYVQVAACNNDGCGDAQATTPPFEHPRKRPSGPSNVLFGITSSTMLTIGWSLPLDIGGDPVTSYVVNWNINPDMTFQAPPPNKGQVTIAASASTSYTITNLSPMYTYYATVSACNLAGCGVPTAPSPVSLQPSLQPPGLPTYITLLSPAPYYIQVTIGAPFIPAHGIACAGEGTSVAHTSPEACPNRMWYGTQADGGSAVTYYEIQYSTDSTFFSGVATATVTVDYAHPANAVVTTVQVPTTDPTYYVRVSAHNSVGQSAFCAYSGLECNGAPLAIQA